MTGADLLNVVNAVGTGLLWVAFCTGICGIVLKVTAELLS